MSEDKEPNPEAKSHINTYWISWIVYLIVLFLIKNFWKDRSEDDFSGLIWGYLSISFYAAMAVSWYESSRFMNYLKENHVEKWTQLKTVFGYSGGNNQPKTLEFIFSSDNLDDPILKNMKSIMRQTAFFFLVVFFSIPVVFILIMFKFR